jgi:hypothetical protein
MPIVEFDPEEGIGERFDNRTLNLDGTVFLGHILRASLLVLCSHVWPTLPGRRPLAVLLPALISRYNRIQQEKHNLRGLLPRRGTNARASMLAK